jgi:hypothetical protein
MFPRFLKERSEDFETREDIAFAFHGENGDKLGVIIDEGNKIGVSLAGFDFIGANVRVDELAGRVGAVRRAGFEGGPVHFGLEACQTFLDCDFVHIGRGNVVFAKNGFQGPKTYMGKTVMISQKGMIKDRHTGGGRGG